ncbi:MAG TPA: glutamate-1-semialdehyde 2,1-aminomutase [Victivallales bacterium]|nr:glutamate-1-semialdehyde 2,1-aminomutase [Victivallales bacterium]
MLKINNSKELFSKAVDVIPGGVNSPVRAFKAVESAPVYIEKGDGAFIYDSDNNEYLDFCSSWGPLILGHSNSDVLEAVKNTADNGLTFGTCNSKEVTMAELLVNSINCLDMVRVVNSGTEAVMSAVRLARGFTGREKILKFDGCYHGHADYLLVASGSGLLTNSISSSAGVPEKAVSDVIVVPFNDIDSVKEVFKEYGNDIACVIVEPVAGNMGLITPEKGFLETLREVTLDYGSLLIFDEVITGFRFGVTSYADICGIKPDLMTLGKIIGGGMPLAAFGGRKDIMLNLAPEGSVYQAGTLSGNPVALSAGIETINLLKEINPYKKISEFVNLIDSEINSFARNHGINVYLKSYEGIFTIFFGRNSAPKNLEDVKKCDTDKFAQFFRKMLENNIYLSPSQFELSFVSSELICKDIRYFIDTAIKVLKDIY